MLRKTIGNNLIVVPYLRFTTSSGTNLDPVFTTGGTATFEWVSPDGSISTGAVPDPALDQAGVYTVKCSDWSDVTQFSIINDFVSDITNLHVLAPALHTLEIQSNVMPDCLLDVSSLPLLTFFRAFNNRLTEAVIDKILADLVANGLEDGIVHVGLINDPPSAAGLVNAGILEGRGWDVTVAS